MQELLVAHLTLEFLGGVRQLVSAQRVRPLELLPADVALVQRDVIVVFDQVLLKMVLHFEGLATSSDVIAYDRKRSMLIGVELSSAKNHGGNMQTKHFNAKFAPSNSHIRINYTLTMQYTTATSDRTSAAIAPSRSPLPVF